MKAASKKPSRLREIQLKEFELLKKLDAFCKKNKIKYHISYGTLLGAVRHKGFIPWDDDIDVSMMREDFDKFTELIQKDKTLKFKSFQTDDDYNYYVPIVYDDSIDIVSKIGEKDKIIHPWVDIFPYDGTPNNPLVRKLYLANCMRHLAQINLSAIDTIVKTKKKNRPFHEKAIIAVGKTLKFGKIFNTKKQLYKLDKIFRKHKVEDSEYIGCLMGGGKTKECIAKKYFEPLKSYTFEGHSFPSVNDYDGYLTHFYGDYMTPPKPEERGASHGIEEE